jgi:hypothetical protein
MSQSSSRTPVRFSGPVLALARIDRVDLLGSFMVPARIVDQVQYEITRPENDPRGDVTAGLRRLHNQIEIVARAGATDVSVLHAAQGRLKKEDAG